MTLAEQNRTLDAYYEIHAALLDAMRTALTGDAWSKSYADTERQALQRELARLRGDA